MKATIFAFVLLLGFFVVLFSKNFNSVQAKPFAAADSSINWKKMDHSERMAYMKKVVLPTMRKEFADFDSKHFAKINCKTCHGAGATDDSFKMPNPDLPKLPNSKEGWQKIMEKKADMLKFMKETVKPKMASLLNMPEYDMKTKSGFGCGNCHTEEK